jgi:non-specific serine/threonine protein kinase
MRRRHAAALQALFARGDAEAECLAEMENAREAFLWACDHDLAAAAQLSARAARVIGFTVWRQEVTEWMLSLQPAMQQASAHTLSPHLQAAWWSMLAYVLLVRRDPAARAAAARAVSLWRELDEPVELLAALGDLVRSITEPGPELDSACAELQQSAATAVVPPRAELRVHGALAEAARVRGDNVALLACREQELRLARDIGWNDMAQAAETNICAALIELGRHAEAAERARALLQRLAAPGQEDNANLAWALYMLGEALLPLRAFDEARTLVPRLLAAERRFGTSMAWRWVLMLVAAQGRVEAAGRLLGYIGRLWTTRQDAQDLDEQRLLNQIAADVQAALGAETAAALAAEGRSMDDAAAEALAARASD